MSVFYEELAPEEFQERLSICPVGYLPLGTIEWHGPHNPLGVDLIESRELFRLAAEKYGGIVFPGLFLGPDRMLEKDGVEYVFHQAARAGFRILFGVGHGPSTDLFTEMKDEAMQRYGLTLLIRKSRAFETKRGEKHEKHYCHFVKPQKGWEFRNARKGVLSWCFRRR